MLNKLITMLIGIFFIYFQVSACSIELIGKTIHSPSNHSYQIFSLIGDGDTGLIFLAQDNKKKWVALKGFYPFSPYAEAEYSVGQQFHHPQVLKTHGYFEVEGIQFLVMEYIKGDTLRTTYPRSHRKEKAIENVSQFIQAFQWACQMHLIHLDLTTTNFMFDADHNLKIIDLLSFTSDLHLAEKMTNQHYLQNLQGIITEILICGDFNDEDIISMHEEVDRILFRYESQLKQPFSIKSFDFFILVLNDLSSFFSFTTT